MKRKFSALSGPYKTQLEKTLALQKQLQHLTHQVLSEHEDKRKKISLALQNEISQAPLFSGRC